MKTDATSVLKGRFPEMSTTEPNSPIARANASATPGQDGREQVRKDDVAERREGAGPQRGGGLLHLAVELEQHRLHGPDHERQRHEQQRQQDRRPRERDVHAHGAVRPVEGEQRQPGDDRREREREVDDRVHDPLPGEAVPDQDPRDDRPHHGVDQADRDRDDERQLERRNRLGVGYRLPEAASAGLARLPDERRQREQDDQAQIGGREPDGEPRPGAADSPGPGKSLGASGQLSPPAGAGSSSRSRCASRRTACRPSPSRRATGSRTHPADRGS